MRIALVLATVLAACSPGGRNGPDAMIADIDSASATSDGSDDGCSDAARLIYVVDSNTTLSKFDPATKTFTDIGQLNCSDGVTRFPPPQPFSMAVDRDAIAWVLYDTGKIFRVDTATLNCTLTAWRPDLNLLRFGMGFSTDQAGGSDDTLFIAGGADTMNPTTSLETLSTTAFQATPIAQVTGWPELTGTGAGELWGWFPSDATGTTTPRVDQIDKQTGASIKSYPLPALTSIPKAWAFGFWGGDFWVFYEPSTDSVSSVHQVDALTGQIKSTTQTVGRQIVGAGVSTCAPVVIL